MKEHVFNIGNKFFDTAKEVSDFIKQNKSVVYSMTFDCKVKVETVVKVGNDFYSLDRFHKINMNYNFKTKNEAINSVLSRAKKDVKHWEKRLKDSKTVVKKLESMKD